MIVTRIALYLGIGALFHLAFVGSTFEWSSAWTWVWLFGWPAMVAIAAALGAAVVGAVVWIAESWR